MGAHLHSIVCLCTHGCRRWACVHACARPCTRSLWVHGAAALPLFPLGFFRDLVFPREAALTLWVACSPQRGTE